MALKCQAEVRVDNPPLANMFRGSPCTQRTWGVKSACSPHMPVRARYFCLPLNLVCDKHLKLLHFPLRQRKSNSVPFQGLHYSVSVWLPGALLPLAIEFLTSMHFPKFHLLFLLPGSYDVLAPWISKGWSWWLSF